MIERMRLRGKVGMNIFRRKVLLPVLERGSTVDRN